MPKQAQISVEHQRAMIAFFEARLAHIIKLGYDLQIEDHAPKYIRIDCSQNDLNSYPNAIPVYEIIGVLRDDMISHLGTRWTKFFKSKCVLPGLN